MFGPTLVVAAHPDDEVLGCGGTLARLSDEHETVHVAFFTDGVGARMDNEPSSGHEEMLRKKAAQEACRLLGVEPPEFRGFPDNQMDTVPRLDVIRAVEELVDAYEPETILTHHAGDVNIDHRRLHEAVVTACRPQPGVSVRRLLFFEIASSTEWQVPGSAATFTPNLFVNIETTLSRKLQALEVYEREMRAWPHSRSCEAAEYYARARGSTVGVHAAEAFIMGREIRQ